MIEQRVSSRYAKALLDTAESENQLDQVFEDFNKINEIFESSKELKSMTGSPVFQNWRKKKIFRELFKSIQITDLSMNFLLLLIDKSRGMLIPNIIQQFIIQFNLLRNRQPVEICSAIELNDALKQKTIKKLGEITGKEILPNYKIDLNIKGGIIIKINDWVYDASIRQQLGNLYLSLAGEGVI